MIETWRLVPEWVAEVTLLIGVCYGLVIGFNLGMFCERWLDSRLKRWFGLAPKSDNFPPADRFPL